MMTPAMREDLAGREQDIQRGKTVELLRRAGKEMYENPIVNTAVGLSPVLGDIQAGVEAYRSAQAGDWGNAGLNAAGMLPFIPMLGKTVWHGSPHTFDKFDLSKIGTGEGAQAYGHGLYLAEARPTAEGYANDLSKLTYKVGNEVFDPSTLKHLNVRARAWDGKLDEAIEKAKQIIQNNTPVSDLAKQDLAVLEKIKAQGGMMPNEGNLYKVDLPDEQIAKMLDWDKPLSEQNESVRNALIGIEKDLPEISGFNLREWMNADPLASTWHNAVVRDLNVPQEELAQKMYQRGIPGLQYFDSGSRGGGDGTRNYVVFSDEIPQILERNNQPVAQALRNYAPKIDEATGLPLNEQGMVTVYHHTNPEAAKQIAETGRLRSAGEPDVYVTSWDKPDTGYGEAVVPIQVDPSVLRLDDEFPSGRMDFAIPVGKSGEFIFKGNK